MSPCKLALLLAVGLLAAADDPKPRADDAKGRAIEGTWVVTEAKRDGEESKAQADDVVVLRDGQLEIKPDEPGGRKLSGTYTLDTSKDPIAIDLKPTLKDFEGENAPMFQGIVKVEDDTMTLAYGPPGSDRPTDFTSEKGSEIFVTVLKRRSD